METGNVKEMLDALNEIKDTIDEWRTNGEMDHWQYSKLFDITDAALAKPPRNCDVGTPEEQAERYENLCDSHTCGSICSGSCCPLYDYDCSPFAWAQMPYEARG